MSVEVYCTVDLNREDYREISMEWWINGYSGLVTPPVGTSPPLNKQQHTDMASYTPLCFNLLLEQRTLLLYIQLKENESRRGKCLPVRLV